MNDIDRLAKAMMNPLKVDFDILPLKSQNLAREDVRAVLKEQLEMAEEISGATPTMKLCVKKFISHLLGAAE